MTITTNPFDLIESDFVALYVNNPFLGKFKVALPSAPVVTPPIRAPEIAVPVIPSVTVTVRLLPFLTVNTLGVTFKKYALLKASNAHKMWSPA